MRLAIVLTLLVCLLASPALLPAAQAAPAKKVILLFPQNQELPTLFMKGGQIELGDLVKSLSKYKLDKLVLYVDSVAQQGDTLTIAVKSQGKGGLRLVLEPK